MDDFTGPPPLDVKRLLRAYGLHPKKSLGQNFLVDPLALRQVAEAAQLLPEDVVLEVGPGLGSLTRCLATRARRVVVVEKDDRLIPPLRDVLAPYPNIQVFHGDILNLNLADLLAEPGYLVVANIPYYITSALLRHLLEARVRPARLVLTVQREVARRICAQPGGMSLLAVSVQVYGEPRMVGNIPAQAFYPPPKVDSSIVRVDLYPHPLVSSGSLEIFFRLARAGFSQKRKTLRNSLAAGMGWTPKNAEDLLRSAEIDPKRRAETLGLDEWRALAEAAGLPPESQQPGSR